MESQARRPASVATSVVVLLVLALVAGFGRPANAQRGERPNLVTAESEAAVQKGLAYLAKTQARDGSWSAGRGYGGGYPTAMTALAGLAFLSAGNTPMEGPYAKNVRAARDYLLKTAARNSSGVIADMSTESSCMHGHGFAMLFLGEVYGMERDTVQQSKIRKVLEKAIVLTGRSQSAAGGWYYQPTSNSDEGSVTVTQIHGLRSCRNAGIKVPKTIIDKACTYIERSSNPDGGISYRVGQGGSRPAITAAAVATMYNAGQFENPVAIKALDYIKKMLKGGNHMLDGGHRYYAMFYAAQAMYLSSAENWKSYFPGCRDDLVKTQAGDGSWNGDGVGPTYGTAIAVVTLQLPYGYMPIFQR